MLSHKNTDLHTSFVHVSVTVALKVYLRRIPHRTEAGMGSNPSSNIRTGFVAKHCLPVVSCPVPQGGQSTHVSAQGHTLTPGLWFCTTE